MPCRWERSEDPLPERESGPVPPDALLLVLATLLLIALALGVAVVLWFSGPAAAKPADGRAVSGPRGVPWPGTAGEGPARTRALVPPVMHDRRL
jgi:hypothetical protein